ncbi:hypothetical protein Hanom_Chr09g00839621 [Helianthus anomalus]
MLSMIHFGRWRRRLPHRIYVGADVHHFFQAYGHLEDCSNFHKTPLLRRCLDRGFLNIIRRASPLLYLSGTHDPILAEYKDLCRIKPVFGLLPSPLRNHTLNVKLIWLRVTFQRIQESFCSDTKLSRD